MRILLNPRCAGKKMKFRANVRKDDATLGSLYSYIQELQEERVQNRHQEFLGWKHCLLTFILSGLTPTTHSTQTEAEISLLKLVQIQLPRNKPSAPAFCVPSADPSHRLRVFNRPCSYAELRLGGSLVISTICKLQLRSLELILVP